MFFGGEDFFFFFFFLLSINIVWCLLLSCHILGKISVLFSMLSAFSKPPGSLFLTLLLII